MENREKMLLLFGGVFMTSVHTVKWTVVPVEPGHNATLNCSLDEDNIFWHMQLLGGDPVPILRTYSKVTTGARHFSRSFKARYSLKKGNRLVIHNVNVEDMKYYYCTATQYNTTFLKETFHLVSAGALPTGTSERDPDLPTRTRTSDSDPEAPFWPNGPLTLVSLALNVILITAGFCYSVRRHRVSTGNPSPTDATYKNCPPSSAHQLDSTYQTLNPNTMDDNAVYSTVTPT